MSKRSRRFLVVDGVTYTWRYGKYVEVRCGRAVVLRRRVTDILGVTSADLERAKHKGYGYPLTPKRIAALIREARA